MTISYYGEGCFKIQSEETTILTDPFNAESGLTPPRFKFDVLIKTLTALPLIEQPSEKDSLKTICGAGEYDVKNIGVIGFPLSEESTDKYLKTAYLVNAEGIKICLLGHISKFPEPEISKNLEEIDILIIPAGGEPFIEQKTAAKLIKTISPKIIIPSFFKLPGLKRKTDDVKIFLEEINHGKTEPREKLTIKKKDLSGIKTEIALLKI